MATPDLGWLDLTAAVEAVADGLARVLAGTDLSRLQPDRADLVRQMAAELLEVAMPHLLPQFGLQPVDGKVHSALVDPDRPAADVIPLHTPGS